MDNGEEQIFSLSQTPDKEVYHHQNQNQTHIINKINEDQNQLGEQANNSISWMNTNDFNLSDEEFTSPSYSLPQIYSLHTQNNPLLYPLAFSSSSSRSSIWAVNQVQVPSHVPRSLPKCSSEIITLQSLIPNSTPVAEMQLGSNNMKNICGSDDDDDDVVSFIREWLERNKGVISLEDIRSIRLKNSTVEHAERYLGRGRRGRMRLVQLVLMWAQNYRMKNKGQKKFHEFDPLLLSNQDGSSASEFATIPLYNNTTGLQQTHYSASPTNPLYYYQEKSMASISWAARKAQQKRMQRKMKMALIKHNRALRQNNSSTAVQFGNHAKNWAFWSSLASNSPNGMGDMDSCMIISDDISSSSSQMMHTNYGSDQHVSSLLWHRRNYATLKRQDMNLKFVLQKVLRRSDVGNLGRIVLPKKEAEIHLPELCSKDGIMIPMEEMNTSLIYKMRYRFWPNNNSRMYVLENTGTFIVQNGLKEGDCIQIYSHLKSSRYMIRGMKARRLQDKRGKLAG